MEQIKKGGLVFLIKIAYRNIYRNKRRTLFCVLAIFISAFVIVFAMGFVNGMVKSVNYVIKTYETGDISIYTKDFESEKEFFPVTNPIETDLDKLLENIKKIPAVRNTFPRITSPAVLMDNNIKNAIVWGIDFENETKENIFNLKTRTNGIIDGHFPDDDENGCVIGKDLAIKMNVKVNDKIPMKMRSSQYSDKYYSPVVTGIIDFDYTPIDSNYIILPFKKMQKLLTLHDMTQTVIVYLKNDNEIDKTKSMIKKLINDDNIVVKSWDENYFVVLFKQFQIIYILMFAVLLILSSFLIINTILMIIHERIKEIGMMGALGMNKREIVQVFFLEAVILSIIGAFFGSIFGGMITLIMSFYPIDIKMFASKGIDMPTSGTIFIDFSLVYVALSFVYGVFVSALCTIFPSLNSAFIEPVEAIRR